MTPFLLPLFLPDVTEELFFKGFFPSDVRAGPLPSDGRRGRETQTAFSSGVCLPGPLITFLTWKSIGSGEIYSQSVSYLKAVSVRSLSRQALCKITSQG